MNDLWYHTQDPEGIWYGKCATREAAIAEGLNEYGGEGFYVTWANNPPIQLSDWIQAYCLLERADDSLSDSDRVCREFDDAAVFEVTPEQDRDLQERIRKACDEWQAAHGLVFTVNTFQGMGTPEYVDPTPITAPALPPRG